jgi:two-component system response regulator RegA
LADKFSALSWDLVLAHSVKECDIQLTESSVFTHCILDLNLENQSGLKLIEKILNHSPKCKIVMLTAYASVQTSIQAIKLGAVYLLAKPSRMQEILQAFDHHPHPDHVRLDDFAKSGIEAMTQEFIQNALMANDYNISKTALQLGIHRRTLQRKLKRKSY